MSTDLFFELPFIFFQRFEVIYQNMFVEFKNILLPSFFFLLINVCVDIFHWGTFPTISYCYLYIFLDKG